MKYLYNIICILLLATFLHAALQKKQIMLVDDADMTKINDFPAYLTLINKISIPMTEDLKSCINRSKNIDEKTKKEITSKTTISLTEDLLYYSEEILLWTQVVNTRIQFCVLNLAFIPCICYMELKSTSSGGGKERLNQQISLAQKEVIVKDYRRLSEQNYCQQCEDKGMVECVVNKLSSNDKAQKAMTINSSYSQDKPSSPNKVWKQEINNLIEEEDRNVVKCLKVHHCCSAFNYVEEQEDTMEKIEY